MVGRAQAGNQKEEGHGEEEDRPKAPAKVEKKETTKTAAARVSKMKRRHKKASLTL